MTTIADLSVIVGANINDLQAKLNTADQEVKGFGSKASSAMKSAARAAVPVAGAIAGIGAASLKAAVDFEADFANVIKTVDGTTEELDALKESIRDMATIGDLSSLDNAHEQLTNIAAIAGQLGVPTSDIEEFTRVIGGMTVATDMSAESAAVFAARFANVTGMPIDEISNLADAIVTLGNNSAAQESEISAVANRLASLSGLNFEVEDILGLSTAIASLGLSAELGSTNVIKTISDMTNAAAQGGPQLTAWADALGVTNDEFTDLQSADPAATFDDLLESLSKMDAADALATLNDLGITSQEQQRTILTLAQGYDTVKASMDLANDSFAGNGALMAEVGAKADTTAGKMNSFQNNVRDLGISLGEFLLPAANKVATALTDIFQGLNDGDEVGASQGFLDLLQWAVDFTGVDIGQGLVSWITAFENFNKIVTLITDDISRRFEMMNLDLQILALDAAIALQNAIPESLRDNDFLLDLKVQVSEVSSERQAFEMVDRLNSHIRNAVKDGNGINLDDLIDLGDGLSLGFGEMMNNLINMGMGDQFSEAFKMNLGDAFAAALSEGDTGGIGQLMDFSQYMTFDAGELNSSLRDAMAVALDTEDTDLANFIYHVAMDLDADVDLVSFNSELTALLNSQEVSATVKANIRVQASVTHDTDYGLSATEAKGAGIEVFHDGGMFYSGNPTGEGLAMLRDGERVLTPEETRAYNAGSGGRGGGVTINYSSFGETPYNALNKLRSAASDAGY